MHIGPSRARKLSLSFCLGCLGGIPLVLSVAATALAAPVDPSSATPVQREQASARFRAGKADMDAHKYEDALKELRASLDIVASPTTRLLAARCLIKMGRLVDGYAELGRTAVEGKELSAGDPRYQKAAQSANEEREELKKQIGLVTITVTNATDDTRVTVGGEELRQGAWGEPAPVMPGDTSIVLTRPGHQPLTESLTIVPGEARTVSLDASAAPPAATSASTSTSDTEPSSETESPSSNRSGLRPWAYAAGGVGVAGFATLAIFGSLASSKYDDLKQECGSGPCPPSRAGDISTGKTDQTVANIGLVVGIVGVAAGTTLFVVSLTKKKADTAPQTSFVVGPGAVGLRGTF